MLSNQSNTLSTIHQENRNSHQTYNVLMSTEASINKSVQAKSNLVKSKIWIVQTAPSFITNTNIYLGYQTMGKELFTFSKKESPLIADPPPLKLHQ